MHFLFIFIIAILISGTFHSQETSSFPVDTSFALYTTNEKVTWEYPIARLVKIDVPDNIKAVENVVYTNYGKRDLHLDLFVPVKDNPEGFPAVIFIHGGGWRSGNRYMEKPFAMKLASEGFVTIPVEYRLSPEAKYPAAIYDLKAAIRWIRKNASLYKINPHKIAVLGVSGGGTLAAFLGTTGEIKKFDGAESDIPINIQAIVDIDGILDFTDPAESGKDTIPDKPSAGKAWFGAAYKDNPAIWVEASPLQYVSEKTPPIVFINSSLPRFHAGRDEFINKLKKYNIYSEVHTIENTPHPFWLFHPWFDETFGYVKDFLKKCL